jgi:hypothetical protein
VSDQLLGATDGLHALAEETSIELHRAVADRLQEDPVVLERARQRVRDWLSQGRVARRVAEAWDKVLAQPPERVAAFLVDPSQSARDLRQTSPFAGALDPRTRWTIWRRVRQGRRRP